MATAWEDSSHNDLEKRDIEGNGCCVVCRGCTSLRWSVHNAISPRSSLTRSCTCPCHCRPPKCAPFSSPSSMSMARSCPSPTPSKCPSQVCLAHNSCLTAADWMGSRSFARAFNACRARPSPCPCLKLVGHVSRKCYACIIRAIIPDWSVALVCGYTSWACSGTLCW